MLKIEFKCNCTFSFLSFFFLLLRIIIVSLSFRIYRLAFTLDQVTTSIVDFLVNILMEITNVVPFLITKIIPGTPVMRSITVTFVHHI